MDEKIISIEKAIAVLTGYSKLVADVNLDSKLAFKVAIEALEKQIPKKPIFWEYRTIESPIPNDDWGYECPCCGNRDIDYPEHHCECGQAIDWSDQE